jgi:hypothetical protein
MAGDLTRLTAADHDPHGKFVERTEPASEFAKQVVVLVEPQ